MTSQQFGDELLRHWQLLWPLPAAERIERIKQIELDLDFREQLQAVTEIMETA